MPIEYPSEAEAAATLAGWRGADERLERLVARYGALAPAARHYGLILWQTGELARAATALRCALAFAPQAPESWLDLAGVLEASGDLDGAVACLETSLAHDPRRAQSWLRLAMLRSGLGATKGVEPAYEQAIALDPASAQAHFGLGIFYFNAKRYPQSLAPLRAAIAIDAAANPAAFACLGQSLYFLGDFPAAATAFAEAARLYPDNHTIQLKWLRARFAADVIGGSVAAAIAACRDHPALSPAEFEQTLRQGFHVLSAYGHRDAAIRLGRARLERNPDDPVQAYLLAAVKGEPLSRAPDDYIVAYFDDFAAGFDQQLVQVLDYKAPDILAAMIARHPRPLPRILDLGCGTGLAGPLLAGARRHLTGVDLSPRMLDAARTRGCYDELIEAEAVAYLHEQVAAFDLIVAADVLVYIGALDAFVSHAARALAPAGLLALTIETVEQGFALLPSGRFAHAVAYMTALAANASLTVVETMSGTIRTEAGIPLAGAYILLQSAPAAHT